MKITVTHDDIEKGTQDDCENCPVALAIKRAGFAEVEVGCQTAKINGKRIAMPRSVERFVKRYDAGDPIHFAVEPFTFVLPSL